eukprot:TRINITY_DN647_c0_g2_i3.p3 TRINITY_DN647_c0_g2~~TRINITY_DN647_c0_g2_i3.p3  ORF type:complete len:153 (-),score=43.91 TRINITY_DN647_c0_g2_i3:89-547(-)
MRKEPESIEFEELGDHPVLADETDDGGQGLTELEGDSWYGQTLEPTAAAQYRPTISEIRFTRENGEEIPVIDEESGAVSEDGMTVQQRTASIFNRPNRVESDIGEDVGKVGRSDSLQDTSPLNNSELNAAAMGARKYGIWDGVFVSVSCFEN